MKKIAFYVAFSLSIVISSCTKDSESSLSEEDQKAIVLAIFNAGANSMAKSRSTQSSVRQSARVISDLDNAAGSIPINNDFEYDYPDGHGGNMHLTVDTGGYTEYDDKTYQCLGGILMITVTEKANHFRVGLSNGREVYVDIDPSVVYAGNFYLMTGCQTFDSAKSFFRITGTYRCNGISYDIMLTTGKIKADGSCQQISGMINGIAVSFVF